MPDFLSVKLAESLDEEFLALFKENQDWLSKKHK
jgi:hypothetical protein